MNETNFLDSLLDDFGVWQHTNRGVLNKEEGYALDDSARALIVYILFKNDKAARICLTYLEKSVKEHQFIGFFDKDRKEVVFPSSDDAFGLAVWALSFAIKNSFEVQRCEAILSKIDIDSVIHSNHTRAIAYLLLSYSYLNNREKADTLYSVLKEKFESVSGGWFEDHLYYGNAVIPYALLIYINAFGIKNDASENILTTSIRTLEKEMKIGVIPSPVGNRKWHQIGAHYRDVYGQQPIDAGYMVLMYVELFKYSKKELDLDKAKDWMEWFYGNNIWKKSMISDLGACSDGLDEGGISENHGAESTIVYLWAKKSLEQVTLLQ